MNTYVGLLLLGIACSAQSASSSFDEEHIRGIRQNPDGVTFTISTIPEGSAWHLSDMIRFKVKFKSRNTRIYTAEIGGGGSAAGASFDFVFQGPGMATPIHSQPSHPFGIVCCDSKRRYLGPQPLTGPEFRVSLKRIEDFTNAAEFGLSPSRLEPGDYVVFAQTRSIMRGWPKSGHDAFYAVSNLLVTSNILHITILPDGPTKSGRH